MDNEAKFAYEILVLRSLCDEATPREQRQRLILSLTQYVFLEPEHQVVFESICALFPRGPFSAAQLLVHLNNRGFPETEVEKFYHSPPKERFRHQSADKIRP